MNKRFYSGEAAEDFQQLQALELDVMANWKTKVFPDDIAACLYYMYSEDDFEKYAKLFPSLLVRSDLPITLEYYQDFIYKFCKIRSIDNPGEWKINEFITDFCGYDSEIWEG